jgi:hypothetical protein
MWTKQRKKNMKECLTYIDEPSSSALGTFIYMQPIHTQIRNDFYSGPLFGSIY